MQRNASRGTPEEDASAMEMQDLFFGATGLLGAGYGLYMLWSPGALADSPGIVAENATAATELRAVFGGIHAAMGVLLLAAILSGSLVTPALACIVAVTGGTGLGRLIGAIAESDFSGYSLGLTAFELVVAAMAVVLWVGGAV